MPLKKTVQKHRLFVLIHQSQPPAMQGAKKQLPARSKVDKKKAPHYSGSGLPTTQLQ